MATEILERPDAAVTKEDNQVLVTLTVGEQLCGVPVLAVRDILGEQTITRIPLAPGEIAGSLNLRGRIVTAIDLRKRLRLPPAPPGQARMSRGRRAGRRAVRPARGPGFGSAQPGCLDVRTEPTDAGKVLG
jgi:chemotaxis signal transduction protein